MTKTDLTRTPNSNRRFVDHNLKVMEALGIPVFTGAPTIGDNPDEAGYVGYKNGLIVYTGGGVWVPVGQTPFVGKFTTLLALQTAVPTGADGQYAIVTGSPSNQEYIWDSDHSDWSLTTNTPATSFADLGGNATDNASLATELTARDTAIATEVSDREGADSTILGLVSALSAALIPHPTYTAPTASLSSSQTTSGLELGQSINIPLTATFNQNNGGASSALSIKKNGTQIATTSPYTDSAVVMSATPIVYQCNFAYAQGPVLNNILGIPDATGRIGASNVNSNSLSYQGHNRSVLGYDAGTSVSLATLLAMGNIAFLDTKARTIAGVTASGSLYTYYAYAAAAGDLAQVLQDGVDSILGAFTKLTDLTGNNANGVSVTMRVYRSNAPGAFTGSTLAFS